MQNARKMEHDTQINSDPINQQLLRYKNDISAKTFTAIRAGTVLGSLLPFTDEESGLLTTSGSHDHLRVKPCDHSSGKSWTIRQDGSVRMACASVVASSASTPGPGTGVGLPRLYAELVTSVSEAGSHSATEDLVGTLQELAGEQGHIYAVYLYEDCEHSYGVLLFGLGPQPEHGTDYLVGIGSFWLPSQIRNTEITSYTSLVEIYM